VYYDTLKGDGRKYLEAFELYLKYEAIAKNKLSLQQISSATDGQWSLEHADCPAQFTSTECGVHVCVIADLVAQDVDFHAGLYTEQELLDLDFRKKIGCEILNFNVREP